MMVFVGTVSIRDYVMVFIVSIKRWVFDGVFMQIFAFKTHY